MDLYANRTKPLSIQGDIWIDKDCECFLSLEYARLLSAVANEGSINAAAKKLSISYQNAWKTVDQMNRIAPNPLIICKRGGRAGGGAKITIYGLQIINEMNQIEVEFAEFLNKINKRFSICF
jgi:molybdate transport system regulatory protein